MKLVFSMLVILTPFVLVNSIEINTSNLRRTLSEKSQNSGKKNKPRQEKKAKKMKATKQDMAGPNPCADKNPNFGNVQCIIDEIEMAGGQSGANVTKGYQGELKTNAIPLSMPFAKAGLCPVNVHWHLGAEHCSVGEYDENGRGPVNLLETRQGFQCSFYDETDPKFTTPYDWKHCKDMVVGQTYEVHWPHSSAGACGTPWQFQTPFIDGVFCMDGIISLETTASQIGVQAQVFTIVNDESYYYGNLFNGMIVDKNKGVDVAYYTGSTTGAKVNNEVCSPYTPITWQVDRKCHLISASSFDKMCKEMKAQADDMEADLDPDGSRELVDDKLVSNNHQLLRRDIM